MRLIVTSIALATLALAAASAAFAQDAVAPAAAVDTPSIALGVDSGSVLVSTGGEFTQAASGQALAPGHRVLVPEGGSATLTYGNGCQKSMASAGVYIITADCVAAGAEGSGTAGASGVPSAGVIAGVVGGVAVIAAAAGGGGGSGGDRPVSR